jgi:hypothetical protein
LVVSLTPKFLFLFKMALSHFPFWYVSIVTQKAEFVRKVCHLKLKYVNQSKIQIYIGLLQILEAFPSVHVSNVVFFWFGLFTNSVLQKSLKSNSTEPVHPRSEQHNITSPLPQALHHITQTYIFFNNI